MTWAELRPKIVTALPFAIPVAIEIAAAAAWLASHVELATALLVYGAAWELVVVVRKRGTRSFLFHAVACTLFAGIAAGVIGGPRAATLLLPAGLACLLVGLGLAHRAAVRDLGSRVLAPSERAAEEPATTWLRDRAAILLALPTVLLALLLAPVATWRFPASDPAAPPPSPPETQTADNPPGGAFPTRPAPTGPTPLPRPGELRFPPNAQGSEAPDPPDDPGDESRAPARHTRRPDSWKDRAVVMEVRPSLDGKTTGTLGPLYLRGLPVTQTGGKWRIDVPPTRTLADADDGRADGWCELTVRPAHADRVDLAVTHERTDSAPDGSLVVFSPPGTAAVSLPRVRIEPGGLLLTGAAPAGKAFGYGIVALRPQRVPFPGQIARVVARDGVAKPPAASDAAAARFAALAQKAAENASSPVDKVRAVMQHLRDHYGYDDAGAGLDDPGALGKLLTNRAGSCTQFAQAGVLMLRAVGIPSRIGTGFLACEWNAKREAYVVRARDAHAWVEVLFEDCGWVIFDPTPREPPGSEEGRPEAGGSGEPPDSAPPAPDDVAPSDDKEGLDEMVGGLRAFLGRIWDWILANPWPCLAAALAVTALGWRAMRRRERRLAGRPVDAAPVRASWDRLLGELARRGHRRRPSQTASEFAQSVVATGGEAYAPFVALTARREAARFGAYPLTPEEENKIDAFRAAIRRTATPVA